MFCLIRHCLFWSPVRGNLQVFLSLYIGQTEWSARFVYKIFLFADRRLVCKCGYLKIHVGKCLFQSRTGSLTLFWLASKYIWGIPENKYKLWWYIKCQKNVRKSPASRTILNYVNFLAYILLASNWFKNNQLLSQLTHAHYRYNHIIK